MELKLIRHTTNPEELLTHAYSMCYKSTPSIEAVIRNLKHESVLEHVTYTFEIKLSRVAWEQQVRHRIASYTAQSHRYTEPSMEDCYYYIPKSIEKAGIDAVEMYVESCVDLYDAYRRLREEGVDKQDARYILPKGVAISALVTINLRSLINFWALRLAPSAQDEIKELAKLMWDEVMPTLPNLYQYIKELINKKIGGTK